MDFNSGKPIYLQMADRLMDEIVAGVYMAESRIPSVREYAVSLGVNTNTAMKAYDALAQHGIIYNKRGLGYFVTPGATEQIKEERRHEFYERHLPQLEHQMEVLGISVEELTQQIREDQNS
jgi:GntR family transcriptional regulator